MGRAGMGAGDKGVQPFDPVDKTLIHQKAQRAIGDGRFRSQPFGIKPRQHVIGTKGSMAFKQDFQHPAAHG